MTTDPAEAVDTTREILDAVRAGRGDRLPALLQPLDVPARRALLTELTALRREVRGWDWNRWQEREEIRPGLLVAGAACQTGAAAAAAWIGARDLRRWGSAPADPLLTVLADRNPAWLADVAHRLAARAATAADDYRLIAGLVRIAGCPVPTTDAFVHGWARSVNSDPVALRADPHVRELVPRLFETVEPAPALRWHTDPDRPGYWPSVLAGLAQDGIVERRVLVDGCTARLLRGGRPNDLKFFLALLRRLALTPAEEREHIPDWTAMAADGPSPLAGYAQEVLARLAEAGELPARQLAEMSGSVLFRPEKKLVRAQLVLLGKALRRDPDTRDELLPAAAAAFGHPDTALQERALKLVAKHLRTQDTELRAELADQTALLSPVHRTLAAQVLGAAASAPADDLPYEELLPPAPQRRRLEPAPDSVAETVELVAALVKSRTPALTEFERALDGLVRHARRDRAELATALRPALADRWWHQGDRQAEPDRLHGIEIVAAAVLGCVRTAELRPVRQNPRGHGFTADCAHAAMGGAVLARLREAAWQILTAPLPFLLATPTWDTGTLEPQELVERLAEYARAGVQPTPADFAQALLRVRRDAGAAPAAAALGTPEGQRLAAWLTGGGEPGTLVRGVREPGPAAVHWWERTRAGVRRIVVETGERRVVQQEFPAAFRDLGRPHLEGRRCYHWQGEDELWRGVLPEDRETLAAWALPDLTACATTDERGGAEDLPRLAELGGPAGPVLHLAVATGLGARHTEDRLAAVDALLVLGSRGELDAARVGRDLAELLRLGTVKPNRLADSARTAAATGAYGTTWAVLAQALPALLEGAAGHRGAGEVLAVAADCAERSGATGPVPEGLALLASRPGTSQLLTQARRLHAATARTAAAAS
ncbi:hypothetical protein GPJ59_19070 [Streptomyces bambusae]|uniref:DUF7824 domain-containing protein n=2 Tax=Streptomyces bambusae TaxID=1550616 RepID=A0ABS6Z848_9ACTN|nr:hypothetical protein [Streptomyces bambusae]